MNVLSYESTIVSGIHVVGDSCSTAPQPKAGHMGNQQGKVCADAIVRRLRPNPLAPDPSPATATVGFSPITADTASWFTTVFQATTAVPAAMVAFKPAAESANPTDKNFEQLFKWFGELHADTLG